MNQFKLQLLIFCLGIGCIFNVHAQSTEITFNVNLKPHLKDSTFIPSRDNIKIVGDLYPINTPNPYYLIDEEPVDSIYSVTIPFSPRLRNNMLRYNFEMMINSIKEETMPRAIQLQNRNVDLDPIYFNAFAR